MPPLPQEEDNMRKPKKRFDAPFDATWTVRVRGRTQADGELFVVTSAIIRDQLQKQLDDMVLGKQIQEYTISVTIDNISVAKETMEKNT